MVAVGIVTIVCGCSGADPEIRSGGTDTDPSSTGLAAPDAGLISFCDDVEPPGPVREGNLAPTQNIEDHAAMGAIAAYTDEHADTYGGRWIDRAAGGTFVVAFTDDPGPHLDALLARRASPGDPQMVSPAPEVTDDTTVAESGVVVDVVQVAHTEAELQAIAQSIGSRADMSGLGIFAVGSGSDLNRVTISVELADEGTRRALAELGPADALCVEGPAEVTVTDPGAPTTLLPPDGDDALVSCDSIAFPLSALDGPTGAELADDPAAEALRETIATGPMELGGPEGATWRVLVRDDANALFGTGEPPDLHTVAFEHERDRWVWAGSGGCTPRPVLPDGIGPATWRIDPGLPPPSATDRELHLLVNEISCTGGTPIGDRLVGPEVRATDTEVVIAFGVESLGPGSYTCPGNPPLETSVTLDVPLGDRELLDGGTAPPAPPA